MLYKGDRFQYQSVVDHYRLRPDYAPAIYTKLFSLIDRDSRVLDLGCGPGKLSYPLARHAARVDAVDLSPAMIHAAKARPEDDDNIIWITGDPLALQLSTSYDLMVAGASVHWMDLDRLLPTLVPPRQQRTYRFH